MLTHLQLDKATAHKALRRLAATADVESAEGRYRLVDPLFAEWIGRLREDAPDLAAHEEA